MLRLVNWHTLPDVQGGAAGAARYPTLDFDAAPWLADVDRILLSSEPYRFTQTHCDALERDPRLAGKRIELIDGEMVSWYGVRAIEGIDYLMRRAGAAEHDGHAPQAPIWICGLCCCRRNPPFDKLSRRPATRMGGITRPMRQRRKRITISDDARRPSRVTGIYHTTRRTA